MTELLETPLEQTPTEPVEHIVAGTEYLATIIRANFIPSKTTFITPDSNYQQLGFVVYPKGGVIPRHYHLPLERHLTGTPETLIIRRGKILVELYDNSQTLVATRMLEEGDIVLLVQGGHRICCLEDTVLTEVKQGPYTGLKEKETF